VTVTGPLRRTLVAAVALVGLSVAAAPVAAPRPAPPIGVPDHAQPVSLRLVKQTPTVDRGGTFELWLLTDGVPADGSIELVLHGRVRSRSELAASMEGQSLRTQVYRVANPLSALPQGADGSRRLSISLDPAGGVALSASGAYPVEVIARDAAGTEVASLVTHLLVEPSTQDQSPPLAVALVASIDAEPSLPADGEDPALDLDVDAAAELVAALAGAPDVPATLAVRPELLDALALGTDPAQTALADALPAAADGRSVLALPYVHVSPDALVDADLDAELEAQVERGRQVLADGLRVEPSDTTWLADDDLGPEGLAALADRGVRHVVVQPDQVEPLRSGLLSLSLAQSFLLDPDADPAVDALALDTDVTDRLGTSAAPGLEISRVLAELAMLWFEQPGIERGVVLPVDPSVRAEVVEGLLSALDGGDIFKAVTLDDLFATVSPLRQPGGGLVDRPLVPDRAHSIDRSVARDLGSARQRLASYEQMLGPDSPRAEPVASQLLLSTAADLSHEEQRAHLEAALASIDAVTSAITTPARATITLTARDGTIPLTLRNDAGTPVHVVMRLHSAKLEFPSGDTQRLTLTDPTTRVDIDVRARASGSFPLEIEVTSPDGSLTLSTTDVTVQSTAVSGVGVVLSAGAALFLLIWWGRHWRRTRRSAKLVGSAHPAVSDAL
jgi:hypothetical protein